MGEGCFPHRRPALRLGSWSWRGRDQGVGRQIGDERSGAGLRPPQARRDIQKAAPSLPCSGSARRMWPTTFAQPSRSTRPGAPGPGLEAWTRRTSVCAQARKATEALKEPCAPLAIAGPCSLAHVCLLFPSRFRSAGEVPRSVLVRPHSDPQGDITSPFPLGDRCKRSLLPGAVARVLSLHCCAEGANSLEAVG